MHFHHFAHKPPCSRWHHQNSLGMKQGRSAEISEPNVQPHSWRPPYQYRRNRRCCLRTYPGHARNSQNLSSTKNHWYQTFTATIHVLLQLMIEKRRLCRQFLKTRDTLVKTQWNWINALIERRIGLPWKAIRVAHLHHNPQVQAQIFDYLLEKVHQVPNDPTTITAVKYQVQNNRTSISPLISFDLLASIFNSCPLFDGFPSK